jgi:DNA-binding LytR/AlgR family response regulator
MIDKAIQWLQTPHPFRFTVRSVVVPGIISFLIILTTAPFGFRELLIWDRFLLGAYFGVIGSLGVFLTVTMFRSAFRRFMNEDHWIIGKEIILILSVVSTICVLNFASFLVLFDENVPVLTLFRVVVLSTVGISVFPVIFLVVYEQYHHQKEQRIRAERMTKELILKKEKGGQLTTGESQQPLLQFESEQGKVEFQIDHSKVMYLKSEGNYLEIFYLGNKQEVKKALLRNRLKVIEEKLPGTFFIRCHKSYIVNIRHIRKVTGNARNYELLLHDGRSIIPVSRSKSGEVMNKLKTLPSVNP